MSDLLEFHFTLGPVQGFVAQSRRTRDLWASSYLLSYLAQKAIDEVAKVGGTLVLPAPSDTVESPKASHVGPAHGTVPNRFMARVPEDHAEALGEACVNAVNQAWQNIAEGVWQHFVAKVAPKGHDTRKIWKRQVDHYWEMAWAAGDEPGLLDRRKNWRSPAMSVEPGEHCMMMAQFQELSGFERQRYKERRSRDAFWEAMRESLGALDLAKDERLCAIALIKRLYPKIAHEVMGHALDAQSWPSTAYLAAAPWIARVARTLPDDAKRYGDLVYEVGGKGVCGERDAAIKSVRQHRKETGRFTTLDGNFFLENALSNENATPLSADTTRRDELLEGLARLRKKAREKGLGEPSTHYALLLMDGDSMGKLLDQARTKGKGEETVSRALTTFADGVPSIVHKHDGVTVYAGGDDVLAMLTLERALECADKLSASYKKAFDDESIDGATLSGALIYTYYATPFRTVLATAHHLLDDVAKDATGRDSLAIAVYKHSGLGAVWSAPWGHIRNPNNATIPNNSTILDDLVAAFEGDDTRGEFSSSFFYRLRERFGLLCDRPLHAPGTYGELVEGLDFAKVLAADFVKGKKTTAEGKAPDIEEAEDLMKLLLKVSQRTRRIGGDNTPYEVETNPKTLGIDGAMVVRFLAGEGIKAREGGQQ
ncbi:type III-B CRISPR-associated protein Cas10/Cmr2 [Lujinxingia vulgaris]|uniref:Type III-B CRISPR-associated protein Cas10/Cmr2 n=1 Tax=Lujinxingia vulgaris TaxID=2600176 RepID=A0A5C6X5V9_9DELT|nr:type III-B CRISPR-associated protein Cas10/Cmr2 [Lujinxingia vulgaris]TXD34080.1 type III-B CRISPR-associated protein Cas10/Cmr2 [Lujinxingia vulgaris]